MAFMKVNNVEIHSPASCTWKLADLSSEESGRSTRTGIMQKDVVARKRTLSCAWSAMTWNEAHNLTQFFKEDGIIVSVTFPDIMEGYNITKRFYTGDISANYNLWDEVHQKFIVTDVTCDFIEE